MDLSDVEQGAFGGRRHPWEVARRRVVRDLFSRTPKADAVLDVGCGDAYLLEGLAEWNVAPRFFGVDSALKEGRQYEHAGAQVSLCTALEEVDADADSITHVMLLDVLEHVDDDTGLLRAISALPAVRHDAHYVITVPAHQALFTEHDRLLQHFRRYSAEQLCGAVQSAGLEVLGHGGFFGSLLLPRTVERIAEALRGPRGAKTKVASWTAPEVLSRVLENTLYRDFRVGERLRRRGLPAPGLSLYLIARSLPDAV